VEATFCDYCEICYQLDAYLYETIIQEPSTSGGIYRNFTTCKDCSGCIECKPNDPPGLKGHSMLMTKHGVLVYGGATWTVTDLELADKIAEEKEKFEDNCGEYMELESLTVDDIGSEAWNTLRVKYAKSFAQLGLNNCFDVRFYPPFPETERTIYYNEDVFFLPIATCPKDCSGKGSCNFGR